MLSISPQVLDERVTELREFHRFYVSRMGFLNKHWAEMLTLTEARVMYEITLHTAVTASTIAAAVNIDAGYLSRVLRKFEQRGYIKRKQQLHDKRQRLVAITAKGRKAYAAWSKMVQEDVTSVLRPMTDEEQRRMLGIVGELRGLIEDADKRMAPLVAKPVRRRQTAGPAQE